MSTQRWLATTTCAYCLDLRHLPEVAHDLTSPKEATVALPGITKARKAARSAELDTLIARGTLSDFIRHWVEENPQPRLVGAPVAIELARLSEVVFTLDAKEQALWAEVDFLSET